MKPQGNWEHDARDEKKKKMKKTQVNKRMKKRKRNGGRRAQFARRMVGRGEKQ